MRTFLVTRHLRIESSSIRMQKRKVFARFIFIILARGMSESGGWMWGSGTPTRGQINVSICPPWISKMDHIQQNPKFQLTEVLKQIWLDRWDDITNNYFQQIVSVLTHRTHTLGVLELSTTSQQLRIARTNVLLMMSARYGNGWISMRISIHPKMGKKENVSSKMAKDMVGL